MLTGLFFTSFAGLIIATVPSLKILLYRTPLGKQFGLILSVIHYDQTTKW